MNRFLVLIACVGFVAAESLVGIAGSSYRYQDELGQHAFGHVGGPNSREEVKTADGVTRGSYSYVDGHGLIQSAVYAADAHNGFRVAATNLPVGPAVPAGDAIVTSHVAAPVVAAPVVAAAPAVVAARTLALPGIIPSAALIHSLKKRDLIAVHQPLTSYPGSTAPLVHAPIATPLVAHTPYIASPFAHYLKKRSVVVGAPLAYAHAIHPGSLSVPLDEPIVAHAKAASIIQQHTEAIRNNIGGIPLALPADTPEVAAGKIAHSIAHAHQAAAVTPALYAPYAHVLKKRAVLLGHPLAYTTAIHPGALSVPLDEPIVAHAKAASIVQQHTEAIRNNIGGIPLALPADTPEVAAGKIAHSIAHAHQAAAVTPALYAPYAHVLKKRAVLLGHPLAYTTAIHPGALSVPLDEPVVAHAKAASIVQQHTEAIRNNVGGIPLALPADTPEVAAGKIAHSIAHAHQAAITHPYVYHL